MRKTRTPVVRLTICLPPDLAAHALSVARNNHYGNLSAYMREVLQSVRKSSTRKTTAANV